MSQKEQPASKPAKVGTLVWQIGCVTGLITIVIIGLAFGAGRFLDNYFDANGIFTVLLLLASFPITLFLIIRISLFAVGRAKDPIIVQVDKEEDIKSATEEDSTNEI